MGSGYQLRDVLLISPMIGKGVSRVVPTPVIELMNVNTQMLQLLRKEHGCVPIATKFIYIRARTSNSCLFECTCRPQRDSTQLLLIAL